VLVEKPILLVPPAALKIKTAKAAPPASSISKSPTSELGTALPPRPENRCCKAASETPQTAKESDSEMDLGDVAVARAKHSERQKKATTKRNKVNSDK